VSPTSCPSPAPPKGRKHYTEEASSNTEALEGFDAQELNGRSVALILSTLQQHSSANPTSSSSPTFEVTLGSLHITIHDGSMDPQTAIPTEDGSVGFLAVLIHSESDPIHHNFHHHHQTFRDFATRLGRSFYSAHAPDLEKMVSEEFEKFQDGMNSATAESLNASGGLGDPETIEEFVGFETEVVGPLVESIFEDKDKEQRAATKRKTMANVRVRAEWDGFSNE
jgi:hypothetical protein